MQLAALIECLCCLVLRYPHLHNKVFMAFAILHGHETDWICPPQVYLDIIYHSARVFLRLYFPCSLSLSPKEGHWPLLLRQIARSKLHRSLYRINPRYVKTTHHIKLSDQAMPVQTQNRTFNRRRTKGSLLPRSRPHLRWRHTPCRPGLRRPPALVARTWMIDGCGYFVYPPYPSKR